MRNRIRYLAFFAATIGTICVLLYNFDYYSLYYYKRSGFRETFQHRSHVLFTTGCKVPKFDPFDPTVLEYYSNVSGDIPCKGKKYVYIKNNVVFLNETQVREDFSIDEFNCTYKPIYRNPKNKTKNADREFEYGEETVLNFNQSLADEFVKVFCGVRGNVAYEDFLASTPIKPAVEERCRRDSHKIKTKKPLNIIVVGIDSVSKLNFERHFKMTAEYLRKNLSAFEFHGYVKVADNTFPNLTPFLTGHFVSYYYSQANKWRYFDDLDFIWKNFSSIGYRTLLAEDAPDMATFNYIKSGFQYPATDYFFRPVTLAIEDSPWQLASNTDCFQANPEIVVLFNYLRSFLNTMDDRPYFAFTWAARITHGLLNKAGYADKPSFELLRDMKDMGYLDNSVLVFMSDHGIRYGGIRKTFIGKIEERMPYMFISFPQWFLEDNAELKDNLITNQKRLTTPFDMHETLVDLYQMTSRDRNYVPTPYGISLFREISTERNCQSAFIHPHWCVCHEYELLAPTDKMAVDAALETVSAVNNITRQRRAVCAELALDVILDARVSKPEDDLLRYQKLDDDNDDNTARYGEKSDSFEKLMITFKTKPGGAEFESTVRKVRNSYKVFDISRINMYGSQGDCVDDSNLRKYCYCQNI